MADGPTRYWGGHGSEGWGRNFGILNFSVDSSAFRQPAGARDAAGNPIGGQFTSDQAGLAQRNHELAMRVQAQVVDNISSRLQRRAVSTGRLLKVTADPANRDADTFGFSVGIEDHLDTSMAKYWRTIEEGSERVWSDVGGGRSSMIGLPLKGFWGGSITGMRATPKGLRALGGEPFTKHGEGWGGKFIPARRGKHVKTGKVQQPIDPMWAYRDAYRSLDVSRAAIGNFREYLDRISRIKLPPIVD